MKIAGDLDAVRAAIDADKARLCRELGLRADGNRFFCPLCQADGAKHADGDLSVERGFCCHKCGWTGDGLSLIRAVRSCDFPAAVEIARGVYGVPAGGSGTGTGQATAAPSPARKPGKIHADIQTAAAAAVYGAERQTGKTWRLARTDIYQAKDGAPVAAVLRLDREDGTTEENGKPVKTFRPAHAVKGGWRLGDPSGLWPIYKLPAIVAGTGMVWIVEGEKTAEAGATIGLTCTTSAHGSKSPGKTDWAPLRGRSVAILPDNDPAGMQYAQDVASLAQEAGARSVKIVTLPGLPHKGDLVDFIQARPGTDPASIRAEIECLARAAPVWKAPADGQSDEPEPTTATTGTGKPKVLLPGGAQSISVTAHKLGDLLAERQQIFYRGGAVVRLEIDHEGLPMLRDVHAAALASDFETVAALLRESERGGIQPATCPESVARVIHAAAVFRRALPPIAILTRCPVLIERDGALVQVVGYDRQSGVLAHGEQAVDVTLVEARDLLNELVADFKFPTAADRARALAAFITPALVLGGLLRGRAPVDLAEADASQSGKGFRVKLKSAVFNETCRTVTQKPSGGVGGLEESFNAALIRGASFVCLDNLRGRLDSPAIESFLTEDHYTARAAYSENTDIDPRRVVLMITSNKADVTPDLANRSVCCRILKQPEGYAFRRYPEGDILDHVRANQTRFLGAVFAVVRAWHEAGRPRTDEARHDFRAWAQTLDWMTRNLLQAGPLLDGHRETQLRMTNPVLNWLRDVALVVIQSGQGSVWLRAGDLVDLLAESPVEVPGLPEHGDPSDPDTRKAAQQGVGRKLGLCFKSGDVVTLDVYTVTRRETYQDDTRHTVKEYCFARSEPEGSLGAALGADRESDTGDLPGIGACPYAAPKDAPNDAPMKTLIAPNAPDGFGINNNIPFPIPSADENPSLMGTLSGIGATGAEIFEGDALDLADNMTRDEHLP